MGYHKGDPGWKSKHEPTAGNGMDAQLQHFADAHDRLDGPIADNPIRRRARAGGRILDETKAKDC